LRFCKFHNCLYKSNHSIMSNKKNELFENNLSGRLKKFRLELNLTQDEFAEKLSISGSQISAVERGKSALSGAVISEIVSAYQINREFLEHGTLPIRREKKTAEKLVRTSGKNQVTKNITSGWENDHEGQPLLSNEEPLPMVRNYRELARMDADTFGEIQTWLNDMERLRPGYTGWFRLEFQNRFPEFDEWKGRILKKGNS